jgi:adenylate cyclase
LAPRLLARHGITARELRHPVSLAYALSQGVCVTNVCLRRPHQVQEAAAVCLELSAQLSLPLFQAFAHVYHGWARVQLGDPAGCEELEQGMREKGRVGAHRWEQLDHLLLADALTNTGCQSLALTELERARAAMSVGDDVVFAAEIERRCALARMQCTGGRVTDELQHAMAIARRQGALALELRAACDLARIWADSGARQRARSVLEPVLAAFTEGFATLDLSEARTLFDQLQH